MPFSLPEDRYLNAGGIRTRYWSVGKDGPPLILIHGLGASSEIWYPNIEPLGRNYRVLVPDLPGFGYSARPHYPLTPAVFTRFLGDFMNALGLKRASLIGQSLGGGIALFFTLRHPERTDRLVLAGSAGLGCHVNLPLRLLSFPHIGKMIFRPSRRGVSFFFKLAVKNSAAITSDLIDVYYEFFLREEARTYMLQVVRSIMDIHGARRDLLIPLVTNLHRIASPTLIV